MNDRKIIFEARVGSHLYGTSTLESDEDFLGVFIHSVDDLLGLENAPQEWKMNIKVTEGPRNGKGDVDRKYLSLKQFIKMAAEGQAQALELLFIPENMIISKTPEWDIVMQNRGLFISQQGIRPILGFAVAQAKKATHKAGNYTILKDLLELGERSGWVTSGKTLQDFTWETDDGQHTFWPTDLKHVWDLKPNEHGFPMYFIANNQYDPKLKLNDFMQRVAMLVNKYGTRTKSAALDGHDFKSWYHAYRLVDEAKEFIQTGQIKFPRPNSDFLRKIKEKEYDVSIEEIDALIKEVDVLTLTSPLKAKPKPNYSNLNKMLININLTTIKESLGD